MPTVAVSGATEGARGAPFRFPRTTAGRAGEVRRAASAPLMKAAVSAWPVSAAMRAKALCGRCLRRRRRLTAASSEASQASWKPPIPRRATMRPSRRAATARAMGSLLFSSVQAVTSGRTPFRQERNQRRGPQAGQAMGWASKRRSSGSVYSREQSGQRGKQAMEVVARS